MTYNKRTWLRKLIRDKDIPQTRLAARLGVSRQTFHAWQTGQQTPDRDRVFQLAELLGPDVLTHFAAEAKERLARFCA